MGGLISNRLQENRERKGRVLRLENVEIDLGKILGNHTYIHINCFFPTAGELGPLIERPLEATLQGIDLNDLLPLLSVGPVPTDFQFGPTLPEYVSKQRIEFLLVQKPTNMKAAWSFPSEERMRIVWNNVHNKLDSDYILNVCLWCRHNKVTGSHP